jgi:hypothetical protein
MSVLLGVSVAAEPASAFLVIATAAVAAALTNATLRLASVVVGGLLTLQSSQTLDLSKVAYLVLVIVGVAVSFHRLSREDKRFSVGERWLIASSIPGVGLAALSFVAARLGDVPVTDWLRDITPYLLLAVTPVIAVDAGRELRLRSMSVLLSFAGVLAAVSVTIAWVGRRGFAELPIDRLLLPSGALAACLVCLLVARYMVGIGGRTDIAICGLVLGLLLATGTRSVLTFLVPVALIMAARAAGNLRRISALTAGVIATIVVVIPLVAATAGFDISVVLSRFITLTNVTSLISTDQSFADRAAQNEAAWRLFITSPLIGTGPGTMLTWITSSGEVIQSWNADAPAATLAKFGIVGATLLAIELGLLVIASARPHWRSDVWSLSIFGFVGLIIAGTALGPVLDDKGYAFGLLILCSGWVASSRNGGVTTGRPQFVAARLPRRHYPGLHPRLAD